MGEIVERIERLLVPAQAVALDRPAKLDRGDQVELAVDVDRQPLAAPTLFSTASMRSQILGERHAADLHFHAAVAQAEIALHLVLQRLESLPGE